MNEPWQIALIAFVVTAAVMLPCMLAVMVHRRIEARASAALAEIILRNIPPQDARPLSTVAFPTYHGVLIWVTQTKHEIGVPRDPSEAEAVLAELKAFTFRYGMFAYGCGFIPLLTLIDYRRALSRIRSPMPAV